MSKNNVNESVLNIIFDEKVQYFTDVNNPTDVYVEYPNRNDALCFESIYGVRFEAFVGVTYRKMANEQFLPNIDDFIEAKRQDAIYDQANPVKIQRRVAGSLSTGEITYFLADADWNSVTITPEGWSVSNVTAQKFITTNMDKPQAMPQSGGSLQELLRPFVNLDDDNFLLMLVYIIQSFSRTSSHFAAILSSDKGSGKSTLTKILREIIDPSHATASLLPATESDLKVLLANSFLVAFDNTAPLSDKFSNILCAAITGSKEVKRRLYHDSDAVILDLHNLVVINGIDVVPQKSDLAERSLLFELKKISKEERRTDAELWRLFEQNKAQILGAVFDTLVKAMQILPDLKIDKLERMADATLEMTAIAVALGIEQDRFQAILEANLKALADSFAENNPLVEIIASYMVGKIEESGTSTEVYNRIRRSLGSNTSGFPNSASHLSRALKQNRDALEAEGFYLNQKRRSGISYLGISRIPASVKAKTK